MFNFDLTLSYIGFYLTILYFFFFPKKCLEEHRVIAAVKRNASKCPRCKGCIYCTPLVGCVSQKSHGIPQETKKRKRNDQGPENEKTIEPPVDEIYSKEVSEKLEQRKAKIQSIQTNQKYNYVDMNAENIMDR